MKHTTNRPHEDVLTGAGCCKQCCFFAETVLECHRYPPPWHAVKKDDICGMYFPDLEEIEEKKEDEIKDYLVEAEQIGVPANQLPQVENELRKWRHGSLERFQVIENIRRHYGNPAQ